MPGALRLKAFARSQLPAWEYISEQAIELDGASEQALTLPSTCSIIEIRAEGGEVYFCINASASANSGGYIPQDGGEIIGPLSTSLASVNIFSTTASTIAHILYFRET